MGLNLAGEVRIHGSLTGWADGDRLLEIGLAALSHPRNLGSETLNVLLLALQVVGADKDWEISIPNFEGLVWDEQCSVEA